MMSPLPDSSSDALRAEAAKWTIRRDRGLSATESIEYELWLAADPRHAAAMQRSTSAWSLLDRMPDQVAQQALQDATRRRLFWRRAIVAGSLAAAAAIAVVALRPGHGPVTTAKTVASEPAPAAAGPRQLTLSDGTVVQLNTASELVEQFTAGERRVWLAQGEANFSVAKNPARPFVVRAGHVEVRAVGTAFNVHLQSATVEVLVTEGVVQLNAHANPGRAETAADAIPLLNPGERAVVALAPVSPAAAVVVTTVSHEEISKALAWQEPLLRLSGATLAEIAASFERRTGRRVILADPALAGLRLGGRFRADDIEGFTNLLATTLEIDVERVADGALVLRKKR